MSSNQPVLAATPFVTDRPFLPHCLLPTADLQTIFGIAYPYFKNRHFTARRIMVPISATTTIAADATWQADPTQHATVVVLPGINGSDNRMLQAIAHKSFHAGYNVVRVNLPNQSGTAQLTKKYYFIGQSEVVHGVLIMLEGMRLHEVFLVGISYGGNICAKAAGELGTAARGKLKGVALLSPAIDPLASLRHIEAGRHPLYERSIVRGLNKLNKARAQADPANFQLAPQKTIRTWNDTHMTAAEPHGWGYKHTDDYLTQNSSMPFIPLIQVPTVIIQSKDDPIVPYTSVLQNAVKNNRHITVLLTEQGGHCGFIGRTKYPGDLDLHWDQNRAIEFFKDVSLHKK